MTWTLFQTSTIHLSYQTQLYSCNAKINDTIFLFSLKLASISEFKTITVHFSWYRFPVVVVHGWEGSYGGVHALGIVWCQLSSTPTHAMQISASLLL